MKIKKGFTLRTVMNQSIIIAEGKKADSYGRIISLNDSAARLWETLKGKEFTTDDVARLLIDKYGIDHAIAITDAEYIISRLSQVGILDND